MAISKNPFLKAFSGTIDGKIVVRQYYYEASGETNTVLSEYPNMSNIIPSLLQKQRRLKFKEANALAAKILSDPEIKAYYKEQCEGNQRPHNVMIRELIEEVGGFAGFELVLPYPIKEYFKGRSRVLRYT